MALPWGKAGKGVKALKGLDEAATYGDDVAKAAGDARTYVN